MSVIKSKIREMQAPTVTVYRNGDQHFAGKKVVVGKQIRNFDAFLDKVTKDTRMQVAVRSLRTPSHGTRVATLDKITNGGIYVAVGPERFRKITYSEIQGVSPARRAKTVELPTVRPVFHSRIHASARYGKVAESEALQNRIVHVYRNGETRHPGIKLLLDKRILTSMDTILQHITHKINLRTGAVKSLYTLDGGLVFTPGDIKSGTKYVAVGYGRTFVKLDYNNLSAIQVTPRKTKEPSVLSPISPRKPKKEKAAKKQASKPAPAQAAKPSAEKTKNQDAWKKHLEEREAEEAHKQPSPEPAAAVPDSPSLFDKVVDLAEDTIDERFDKTPTPEPPPQQTGNADDFQEDLANRLDDLENELEHESSAKSRKPAVPVEPEKVFDKALKASKTNSQASSQQLQDDKPAEELPEEFAAEDFAGKATPESPPVETDIQDLIAEQLPPRQRRSSIDDDNIDDDPEEEGNATLTSWRHPAGKKDEEVDSLPDTGRTDADAEDAAAEDAAAETAAETAASQLTEEVIANSTKNIEQLNSDTADKDDGQARDSPFSGGLDEDWKNEGEPDTVFQATGGQAEEGDHIKDTNETTVEKTIDDLPDEEVEEEIEEDVPSKPDLIRDKTIST